MYHNGRNKALITPFEAYTAKNKVLREAMMAVTKVTISYAACLGDESVLGGNGKRSDSTTSPYCSSR